MQELIRLLKEISCPIIVEGKNDKKALENLGLKKIITLKKPLYKIVEEIKTKEVVILTDLDKKGKQLYGKLKKDLCKRGVKINDKARNYLFRNTKLRQIEGLTSHLERFK